MEHNERIEGALERLAKRDRDRATYRARQAQRRAEAAVWAYHTGNPGTSGTVSGNRPKRRRNK